MTSEIISLDDSFDITRRLNQLRMSIGLDKVPSPKRSESDVQNEKEANFDNKFKKSSSRIPTEGDGIKNTTDRGLSRYLGFQQNENTNVDVSSKPYITNENIQQEVFTLGPAHRSITDLFEEANNRSALSPKKDNNDAVTPRKSYKNYSANKSPNTRKSHLEERNTQPQRSQETKTFEAVKREVQEIQRELERAYREQESPLLNSKYREAATPYDRKAPVSKIPQKQFHAVNVLLKFRVLSCVGMQ